MRVIVVPDTILSAVPLLVSVIVDPPARGCSVMFAPVLAVILARDMLVGTLMIVAAVLKMIFDPGHGTMAGDQLAAVDQLPPDAPTHVKVPPVATVCALPA